MQIAGPDQWRCTALSTAGQQCALVRGHAGEHATTVEAHAALAKSGDPATIVRTYKGSPQRAAQLFEEDARRLAAEGYRPVNQSYVAGSWGCGAFLLALIAFVVLIGILIFIYMLLVKPDGTLTVTYQREAAPAPAPESAPQDVIAEQILQLGRLCDAGVLTPEEFEAKKAELLGRM